MKAVIIEQHGGPEVLKVVQRPKPVPDHDEVLVKVRAVALNHLDVWVRKGVPGHTFPLPLIPGSDVSGVLDTGEEVVVFPAQSCGHCEYCLKGQEQLCRHYEILGESRDGGCAEFIAVKKNNVFAKPKGLDFEEAAAVLLSGLTAYHMVSTKARVQRGEWVAVTGAAGGVGIYALQIAKALGAKVIAIVGTERKADFVRDLGADEVIIHTTDDIVKSIKSITRPQGLAVFVDSVGGEVFEKGLTLLKPEGRLVTCGATMSGEATINIRRLFFRALNIMGSTMGSRWEFLEVLKLVEARLIRPVVYRTLPLEDVAEAHRLIENREVIGKVVLRP